MNDRRLSPNGRRCRPGCSQRCISVRERTEDFTPWSQRLSNEAKPAQSPRGRPGSRSPRPSSKPARAAISGLSRPRPQQPVDKVTRRSASDASRLKPLHCVPLIVAFRSKYTRYSSLTRLVSRAPRPHRENWPTSALTPLHPQAAREFTPLRTRGRRRGAGTRSGDSADC